MADAVSHLLLHYWFSAKSAAARRQYNAWIQFSLILLLFMYQLHAAIIDVYETISVMTAGTDKHVYLTSMSTKVISCISPQSPAHIDVVLSTTASSPASSLAPVLHRP